MGNMPTRGQLKKQLLHTNLWFECGADEMQSWGKHFKAHGGFDPWTRTMTPLRRVGQLDRAQYVLDSIAAAFEEGLYDKDTFLSVCFDSEDELREFLRELNNFEQYWVNERHFYAFLDLVGNEGGCTTYPQVAASLSQIFAGAGAR